MTEIGHNRGPSLQGISFRTHCWGAMRQDMKGRLRSQGLPGDAFLMIGETDHERELMAAGDLAGFITGQTFFAGASDAI